MANNGVADVLLVEDDANDAELTINALRHCGVHHKVEHVSDGDDALDYISTTTLFASRGTVETPRLILLDLNLSRVGGLQVLRQLKTDERTRGIPIIVLTASKLAIEVAETYRLGVNSYVIKPNDPKEFISVVAAVGKYWLSINEPAPK